MRHPLLHTIVLALAAQGCVTTVEIGEACMAAPAEGCLDPAELSVDDVADPWDCDNSVRAILATETPTPKVAFQDGSNGCCYEAELVDTTPNSECVVGRPFRHQGAAVTASVEVGSAWADVALAEHASIAAFAQLQLQLMAWGAPADLLAGVARAMGDEVRHAALAFAMAERFSGTPVVPGRFPFPGPVNPEVSLADLAEAAVTEGCVGETLSALATRRAAEVATDPEVREALFGIADDEDRHAALSWAVVAWAIQAGGAEVRERVVSAMQGPHPVPRLELLTREEEARVAADGLRQVIGPAASVLLAA